MVQTNKSPKMSVGINSVIYEFLVELITLGEMKQLVDQMYVLQQNANHFNQHFTCKNHDAQFSLSMVATLAEQPQILEYLINVCPDELVTQSGPQQKFTLADIAQIIRDKELSTIFKVLNVPQFEMYQPTAMDRVIDWVNIWASLGFWTKVILSSSVTAFLKSPFKTLFTTNIITRYQILNTVSGYFAAHSAVPALITGFITQSAVEIGLNMAKLILPDIKWHKSEKIKEYDSIKPNTLLGYYKNTMQNGEKVGAETYLKLGTECDKESHLQYLIQEPLFSNSKNVMLNMAVCHNDKTYSSSTQLSPHHHENELNVTQDLSSPDVTHAPDL